METLSLFVGTRPDIIKMSPLIKLMQKTFLNKYNIEVVNTNQHRTYAINTLKSLGIKPTNDFIFDNNNFSLVELFTTLMYHCELHFLINQKQRKLVFVHGDTISALATALVSFYHKIPVVHIEAGLRTSVPDLPFPEELNRRLLGQIATWHFAPTLSALMNLVNENVPSNHAFLSGNTIVDALQSITNNITESSTEEVNTYLSGLGINKPFIVVTCHRRESWDDLSPKLLDSLLQLSNVFPNLQFLYILPNNPKLSMKVTMALKGQEQIKLSKSIPYHLFVRILQQSELVITDSGGMLEECATIGKSMIILRKENERPEVNQLESVVVLDQFDTQILVDNLNKLSTIKAKPSFLFGTGTTAEYIVNVLQEQVGL